MKKVGVLTVHRSLNMGSFLQSFALNKYLQMNGIEVYQLNNRSRNPKYSLTTLIKYTIKDLSFNRWVFYSRMSKKFKNQLNYFYELNIDNEQISHLDGVILGSDEIWNVKRKEMRDFKSFWGEGINNDKLFSYAPSINTSTAMDIKRLGFPEECLKKLKKISVRDVHSFSELNKIIPEKEISIVADPTWLLTFQDYLNNEHKISNDNTVIDYEFILIYAWQDRINLEERKSIIEFARKKNLKIVAVCLYMPWADVNIATDAFTFQEYVDKASYIITNTFHGTIFSILSNTQFITLGKGNTKVIEALKSVDLNAREVEKNSIEKTLEKNIDWNSVNKKVEKIRLESQCFIKQIIKEIS